jgi:hypothetical protein
MVLLVQRQGRGKNQMKDLRDPRKKVERVVKETSNSFHTSLSHMRKKMGNHGTSMGRATNVLLPLKSTNKKRRSAEVAMPRS